MTMIDNFEGERVELEEQSDEELRRISAEYRDSIERQFYTGPLKLYEDALVEIEEELLWRGKQS